MASFSLLVQVFQGNIRQKIYEIQTANDIQIKQKSIEKNDFSSQIITEKTEEAIQTNKEENRINHFNKLLITENRSVSFNAEQKNKNDGNKKPNIIISNEKLNILSNIKK